MIARLLSRNCPTNECFWSISKEAKERKRLEREKAAAQLKSNEDGLNCSTIQFIGVRDKKF